MDTFPIHQTGAMVVLLLPPTLAPQIGAAILRNFSLFHSFAVLLARWQQALGAPQDLIFIRTIFELWQFRRGVCYLNHGSFGAVPMVLRQSQQRLRRACEQEPLDWLARQLDPAWLQARFKLAIWLCPRYCVPGTVPLLFSVLFPRDSIGPWISRLQWLGSCLTAWASPRVSSNLSRLNAARWASG